MILENVGCTWSIVCVFVAFADTNVIDEHSNFGLWGDGRGEDELSPEEIQMVKFDVFKKTHWLSFL